ncbi:hypothetical protein ACFL7D_06135 [candidate division KSB1 bacterium]
MKNEDHESGWIKRNIVDESRLTELMEMYKSLGFEVKTEDLDPEKDCDTCNECFTESPEKYKVLYTRKKESYKNYKKAVIARRNHESSSISWT